MQLNHGEPRHAVSALSRLALVCAAGSAALIAFAGYSKGLSLGSFYAELQGYVLLTDRQRYAVAIVVPPAEIALGLLWLLNAWRRVAACGLMLLLLSFTVVYALHLRAGVTPSCGCFGVLRALENLKTEGAWLIVRNSVLILCLGLECAMLAHSRRWQSKRLNPIRAFHGHAGFSLIEVLLSVTIISILVALVLVSINGVRSKAREAGALSSLASHAKVFAAYANDYRSYWPYFGPCDNNGVASGLKNPSGTGTPYFFLTSVMWKYPLRSLSYDGSSNDRLWMSPDRPDPYPDSDYSYSCTFITRPEFWTLTGRSPATWIGTRLDETSLPAKKVVLVDAYSARALPKLGLRMALSDGAALLASRRDLLAGFPGGERPFPGSAHSESEYPPAHHTMNGVFGQDLK